MKRRSAMGPLGWKSDLGRRCGPALLVASALAITSELCSGSQCVPKKLTDLVEEPLAIAAGTGSAVYLRTRDVTDGAKGSVVSVPKRGGAPAPLSLTFEGWDLRGSALRVVGDDVLFTAVDNGTHDGVWRQAGTSSGPPMVAAGAAECGGLCKGLLADGGGYAWFTDSAVFSCGLPGCAPRSYSEADGYVYDVALGSSELFVTSSGSGGRTLRTCPRGAIEEGCTPFVPPGGKPEQVRVHGTNVYWVDNDTSDQSLKARVYACPTSGCQGEPKVILFGEYEIGDLFVGDSGVYVTFEGNAYDAPTGTLKVCRDLVNGCGATLEILAAAQPRIGKIAVDDRFVYWGTRGLLGLFEARAMAVFKTGR